MNIFTPLNAKLNPIRHLLALVGAHHILHVSGVRVNSPIATDFQIATDFGPYNSPTIQSILA